MWYVQNIAINGYGAHKENVLKIETTIKITVVEKEREIGPGYKWHIEFKSDTIETIWRPLVLPITWTLTLHNLTHSQENVF